MPYQLQIYTSAIIINNCINHSRKLISHQYYNECTKLCVLFLLRIDLKNISNKFLICPDKIEYGRTCDQPLFLALQWLLHELHQDGQLHKSPLNAATIKMLGVWQFTSRSFGETDRDGEYHCCLPKNAVKTKKIKTQSLERLNLSPHSSRQTNAHRNNT